MSERKAKIFFILSMTIFGTIALFVRYIPISSGELALIRACLASILIGLFLIITKQSISLKKIKKELPLIIISGIAMGFNWIFLFEAYKYTTVSVATLSYYFAPVIVTVMCPIIFKEKMNVKQWICFGFSTLGIVLITGLGDLSQNNTHLIGILYGLAAAALYATVILINKAIKTIEGIHRTFLQFLSAILILLPYVLLTTGIHLNNLQTPGIICLLVVGLIHTGITYCLYFTSLKEMKGQSVAILSYIDPLVAVIISITILKETISWVQIVGGILIIGFTLWNELTLNKKKNTLA